MSECLSDSDVLALAADREPMRDRRSIDEHLQSCEHCRARLVHARSQAGADSDGGGTGDGGGVAHESPDQAGAPSSTAQAPSRDTPAHSPNQRTSRWQAAALKIEGYEILGEIRGGGQGIVLKALQKGTNRTVAIKVLQHEDVAGARQRRRFEREVRLAASLRHPGIVTIHDSGLASGRYYFVMEYIHGQAVDEYVRQANLNVRQKVELFARICDAVAHAHDHGIVHRDLKPGNILVDGRGQPHVLDFGLAKSAGESALALGGGADAVGPALTVTSQFLGTLAYSSPEQTMGDPDLVDQRSDVYSLGVLLFEMLTGRFPYPMPADLLGAFHSIRHAPPQTPAKHAPDVDSDLSTIVLRMLAKEPQRRYRSAHDVLADIERYLHGEPIAARRDSALYLLGRQVRAGLARHRVLTALGAAGVAWLLALWLGGFVTSVWGWPARWFESMAVPQSVMGSSLQAMADVRMVLIDADTRAEVEAVARDAGLVGVSAEDRVSLRRMHGWMMQRLARAGARAVAWDIAFPGPSDFDADFVRGVKAMQDAGGGVAVALFDWSLNESGEPATISPAILRSGVLWGGNSMMPDAQGFLWKTDLIVQPPNHEPMLSLALAGLSAWRHPGLDPTARIDFENERVELVYRDPGAQVMQSVTKFETIVLTGVRPADDSEDDRGVGLRPDSPVGLYALRLYDESTFARNTLNYQTLAKMSDAELAGWAGGKMIVFGDVSEENVWLPRAHAATIDHLLRSAVPALYPRDFAYGLVLALAAIAGVIASQQALFGPLMRRLAILLIMYMAVALLSLLAYRLTGYLCQPLGPVLAVTLAFVAWLWFDPLYQRQPRTDALPSVSWRAPQ